MSQIEALLLRFFKATHMDRCGGEWFWRTDGEHAPVTIIANVNDEFGPGSDAECLTVDNIHLLENAVDTCELWEHQSDADKGGRYPFSVHAMTLFVATVRRQMPRSRYFDRIDDDSGRVKLLFERTLELMPKVTS